VPLIEGVQKDRVQVTYEVAVLSRDALPPARQRIGVGETVTLSVSPALPGARWAVLPQGHAPVVLQPGLGDSVRFTAPDVLLETQLGYTVVLTLEGPPPARQPLARVTFEVVRPAGGRLQKQRDLCQPALKRPGGAGPVPNAGFRALMYAQPSDVSFVNVMFKEGDGLNVASGAFEHYNGNRHPWNQDPGPDSWAKPSEVRENGTPFALDTVSSAADRWDPVSRPMGSTRCPIDWRYKLKSDASPTNGKVFAQIVHEATVNRDGTVTVRKGGAQSTRTLNALQQALGRNLFLQQQVQLHPAGRADYVEL
jgi:hypothetical protein